MTTARRSRIDPARPVWVHATSRCVRRAFLCGGKFEHRRGWIEARLRELAGVFAVEVGGFAVMANHLHVVLRMAPGVAAGWDALTVARRWSALYPARYQADGSPVMPADEALRRQAEDAAWVAVRRERLADLSWFMRALAEPIARRANREDGCGGRFWQGRFHSVPLLDQAALVAALAYVDLNPVRAKVAATPEDSAHTSVQRRIRARNRWRKAARLRAQARTPGERAQAERLLTRAGLAAGATHAEDGLWLAPMARCVATAEDAPLALDDYLTLVDATGRLLREGKRGRIDPALLPILARLELSVDSWLATMLGWRVFAFSSAIGRAGARAAEAGRLGLAWIRNRCPLFAGDVAAA